MLLQAPGRGRRQIVVSAAGISFVVETSDGFAIWSTSSFSLHGPIVESVDMVGIRHVSKSKT